MIITISGTIGSGKDTLAKFVESYGFEHFSTADILRAETKELGGETDRDNLRKTGNELRTKYGSAYLAEKALQMATKKDLLISGVRSPGEVDLLEQQKDSFLFFVDAPIGSRYQRVLNRGRNIEDTLDFDKFKKSDDLEYKGVGNFPKLSYCKEKADFVIVNDGTPEDLKEKVNKILTKLGKIK